MSNGTDNIDFITPYYVQETLHEVQGGVIIVWQEDSSAYLLYNNDISSCMWIAHAKRNHVLRT